MDELKSLCSYKSSVNYLFFNWNEWYKVLEYNGLARSWKYTGQNVRLSNQHLEESVIAHATSSLLEEA